MESDAPDVLKDQILILSNYFHPEPTGSAPPVSDLALWLVEQGFAPSVLTARPSYPINAVYPGYEKGEGDREVWRGVQVRRLASFVPRSRGMLERLLAEGSFALMAAMSLRRRHDSVIAVCPSVFAVLAALLFRKPGGRVIVIVHDIQSGLASNLDFGAAAFLVRLLKSLEAWTLNRCDAVIALTAAMKSEIEALGVVRPISVIPPQVDVREIEKMPEPDDARPLIIYSGNLGKKQGLGQLLDLAAELKRRGSPARLLIRGEGSERPGLEQKAVEAGLDNVAFADITPRERISEAMAEGVLHLVPQAASGANFALPSKVFSIMAAQRAYIATAAPDTPLGQVSSVSGGGVCVEPDNPRAFADAVEALLADRGRRKALAASGRRYVEREIDREIVCQRIIDLAMPSGRAGGSS